MTINKPEVVPEPINLKVVGHQYSSVQFKIKKHTPLLKLLNAYCERACVAINTVSFRFNGRTIRGTDTPLSLGMEDGDTIEVF